MRTHLRLIGVLVAMMWSGACSSDPDPTFRCQGTGDCGPGRICVIALNACVIDPDGCIGKADGEGCEDGQFCTVSDFCRDEMCVGGPAPDCGDGNACTLDACDEGANACVNEPVANDSPCGAGTGCVTDGACQDGVCEGPPLPDNTPCDDELYCTDGDRCVAGVCQPGAARDCSANDGECHDGLCDENLDTCYASNRPDLEPCDDGMDCTENEGCMAGSCSGGTSVDCSLLEDQCNAAQCSESAGGCERVPLNGISCDDGLFCTRGDACTAGACGGGGATDCSSVADACNTSSCDEALDMCVPVPRRDGTSCDDGLFCMVGEVCTRGVCGSTTPIDCSMVEDPCNTSICSEASDSCVPVPVDDGTACTDESACTVSDECTGGACSGIPNPAQSLCSSIVSHWTLDETSGPRVDSHGPHDLTDHNTVSSSTGLIRRAATFDRANAEDLYCDVPMVDASQGVSVAFWFSYSDSDALKIHFAMGSAFFYGGTGSLGVGSSNASPGHLVSVVTNNAALAQTSGIVVTPNIWHLVIAWYDPADRRVRLQADNGTVQVSTPLAGSHPVFPSTSKFAFGGDTLATTHSPYFTGSLDSATLWNRVLTASERTALYNGGAGLDYPF